MVCFFAASSAACGKDGHTEDTPDIRTNDRATADAFLTDYSSAIFEANMIGIPGFIYADDLEAYIADRGDLFFDMYKLPFPVALNNDELMKQIEQFDEEEYRLKTEQLMKENGIFEDGKASRRVVRLIEKRQRRIKE